MYYWVFQHRLVNEGASMDISLHPHAVRVMKVDDIPESLQQAARQQLAELKKQALNKYADVSAADLVKKYEAVERQIKKGD